MNKKIIWEELQYGLKKTSCDYSTPIGERYNLCGFSNRAVLKEECENCPYLNIRKNQNESKIESM